jgi:hypothetical protein
MGRSLRFTDYIDALTKSHSSCVLDRAFLIEWNYIVVTPSEKLNARLFELSESVIYCTQFLLNGSFPI